MPRSDNSQTATETETEQNIVCKQIVKKHY
jgi:hypothetical protein